MTVLPRINISTFKRIAPFSCLSFERNRLLDWQRAIAGVCDFEYMIFLRINADYPPTKLPSGFNYILFVLSERFRSAQYFCPLRFPIRFASTRTTSRQPCFKVIRRLLLFIQLKFENGKM